MTSYNATDNLLATVRKIAAQLESGEHLNRHLIWASQLRVAVRNVEAQRNSKTTLRGQLLASLQVAS